MKWAGLVCIIALATCLAGYGAPRIFVEEATYDFGVVSEGDVVEHTFQVLNAGDDVLVIESVRAACGCTATMLSERIVHPSASTSLRVTLSTAGYGGNRVSKTITIRSNDPETPELALHVVGEVSRLAVCAIPAEDVLSGFTVLIDLRPSERYAEGHLIGAINIPIEEIGQWIINFPRRVQIVLYDQDGSLIDAALKGLIAEGIVEACGLDGGLDQWIHDFGSELLVSFRLMPGG